MSDPTDRPDVTPAARGEAAWLQHCQEIADRNASATREGKARRSAFEIEKEGRRVSAEAAETARFLGTKKS